MKNLKLLSVLSQFGLEENEARVYLSALSQGATSVLKLSKHSEIKRTTVYEVIDSLIAKGLMKKEIRGFKTFFVAEHPTRLESALESKKSQLMAAMPELEGIFNLKGTESTLKYYEGLRAIKNIYDDLLAELKPNEFYYAISNIAEWQGLDEEFFMKNHVEKRAEMRVNTKLLFIDSATAQKRKQFERNFNEEIKLLPKGSNFHVDLVVTPHRLVMFQLKEPLVAIVVENKSIIEMQKAMFEMLWQTVS